MKATKFIIIYFIFLFKVLGVFVLVKDEIESENELKRVARKRAKEKADFYTHFGVYISVNVFLIVMWYVTLGPEGFPWFIFPLFGWGIGVVGHAVSTFYGESYIERKTKEEYEKIKK